MSIVTPRLVSFGTNKRPKYGNKATVRDGITFHSKREADRYVQLKLLEISGRIRELKLQPEFRLEVNGMLICKYRADFAYEELQRSGQWAAIVDDSKGYKTRGYLLKKKLMKACHGIDIRES